jgi:hypothetical protein
VEIADPGATPGDPAEEPTAIDIAGAPAQPQTRPVPTSVPAGGGAAQRQR